jgi:hypothetical protein
LCSALKLSLREPLLYKDSLCFLKDSAFFVNVVDVPRRIIILLQLFLYKTKVLLYITPVICLFVINIKAGKVLRGDNILIPLDKLVGLVFTRLFTTNITGKYTDIIVIQR